VQARDEHQVLCGIRSDGVHQGALPLMTNILFLQSVSFPFVLLALEKRKDTG